MEIRYFDRDGKIQFDGYEKVAVTTGRHRGRADRSYRVTGTVPYEVVKQGDDAIRTYARNAVEENIGIQKSRDARFDELRRRFTVEISMEYRGIILKGAVICRDDDLVVELRTPIFGVDYLRYGEGFGAAMASRRVWKELGISLSYEAFESAKEQLLEIFLKMSSPVRQTVDRLNFPTKDS